MKSSSSLQSRTASAQLPLLDFSKKIKIVTNASTLSPLLTGATSLEANSRAPDSSAEAQQHEELEFDNLCDKLKLVFPPLKAARRAAAPQPTQHPADSTPLTATSKLPQPSKPPESPLIRVPEWTQLPASSTPEPRSPTAATLKDGQFFDTSGNAVSLENVATALMENSVQLAQRHRARASLARSAVESSAQQVPRGRAGSGTKKSSSKSADTPPKLFSSDQQHSEQDEFYINRPYLLAPVFDNHSFTASVGAPLYSVFGRRCCSYSLQVEDYIFLVELVCRCERVGSSKVGRKFGLTWERLQWLTSQLVQPRNLAGINNNSGCLDFDSFSGKFVPASEAGAKRSLFKEELPPALTEMTIRDIQNYKNNMNSLITDELLAFLIDLFERTTGARVEPVSLEIAKIEAQNQLGILTPDPLQEVYNYWKNKRKVIGKPLLREFWPIPASSDNSPFAIFRARTREKMVLRRARRSGGGATSEVGGVPVTSAGSVASGAARGSGATAAETYEARLGRLGAEFCRASDLFSAAARRDQIKLQLCDLDGLLFEQLWKSKREPSYVHPSWDAFRSKLEMTTLCHFDIPPGHPSSETAAAKPTPAPPKRLLKVSLSDELPTTTLDTTPSLENSAEEVAMPPLKRRRVEEDTPVIIKNNFVLPPLFLDLGNSGSVPKDKFVSSLEKAGVDPESNPVGFCDQSRPPEYTTAPFVCPSSLGLPSPNDCENYSSPLTVRKTSPSLDPTPDPPAALHGTVTVTSSHQSIFEDGTPDPSSHNIVSINLKFVPVFVQSLERLPPRLRHETNIRFVVPFGPRHPTLFERSIKEGKKTRLVRQTSNIDGGSRPASEKPFDRADNNFSKLFSNNAAMLKFEAASCIARTRLRIGRNNRIWIDRFPLPHLSVASSCSRPSPFPNIVPSCDFPKRGGRELPNSDPALVRSNSCCSCYHSPPDWLTVNELPTLLHLEIAHSPKGLVLVAKHQFERANIVHPQTDGAAATTRRSNAVGGSRSHQSKGMSSAALTSRSRNAASPLVGWEGSTVAGSGAMTPLGLGRGDGGGAAEASPWLIAPLFSRRVCAEGGPNDWWDGSHAVSALGSASDFESSFATALGFEEMPGSQARRLFHRRSELRFGS